MSDAKHPLEPGSSAEAHEDLGHPIGTLAIVVLFGLLFGLGWFLMYLWMFLHRGGLHP